MNENQVEPPSKALAHLTGHDYEAGLVNYLRRLFAFLTHAYDCMELPPSGKFELRFANASTLVVIRSEWEGPWVAFDHAAQPKNAECGALPLWEIMAIRNSRYCISPPSMPRIDKFVLYAQAIPECAADLLQGDFTIEPDVERFCQERAEQSREWLRRLYLDSATSLADAAFRQRDFVKVIEHLVPFEAELSTVLKAKLAYARRQIHRT